MTGLSVRRAGDAACAARAAEIDAVVAPEGFLGVEPPVDVAARAGRYHEMASTGDGGLWVLEDDAEIVGYATLREARPGVLSLGMAILPRARGDGGGRALLEAVIGHGRRCGAHKVDLEVWLDNARAIALYSRLGFVIEGVRREHYRRRDGRLRSSMIMAIRVD
jgi:RimJ/RimL family protein N-acetyltransferase